MPEPFSSFMRRALFDPERGYYSRNIRTVGSRGDFATAATLSPLLGSAIANWIRDELSQSRVKSVIEIGGGDGSLMEAVRRELGWWKRFRLHWHMVETSPVLRDRQQARLGRRVDWHPELPDALDACGGESLIYHNELLDAFPCERLEWDPGSQEWREIWVSDGKPTTEELRSCERRLEDRQAFSALREWNVATPPPHAKQRIELHATVRQWIADWAPQWKSGAMLTIDYGDVFPELYHRRPQGTMRAYLLQQRIEGPGIYCNPGRQDLTADINFTDYRQWARDLGWTEAGFGPLRQFFQIHTGNRTIRPNGVDAQLLAPGSAADAFRFAIHRPV